MQAQKLWLLVSDELALANATGKEYFDKVNATAFQGDLRLTYDLIYNGIMLVHKRSIERILTALTQGEVSVILNPIQRSKDDKERSTAGAGEGTT